MAEEPSTSTPTTTSTPTVTAPAAAASASASAPATDASPATAGSDNADGEGSREDGTTSIPVRTKESFQKILLERYIARDAAAAAGLYEANVDVKADTAYKLERTKEFARVRTEYRPFFPPSKLYGEGYQGFGNGFTENNNHSCILYPVQKPRPERRTVQPLRWKKKDMAKQAEEYEELVPLRIDVDWDKIKLRDTFTWNLHERIVPVELFAAQLVEDLSIKPPASQAVFDQIVHQMREQLADYYPFTYSEDDALDPELPYSAYKNDEMRMLIKLNITIGQHTLVDQFEWDLNNQLNSPEEFALSMARDLSLSGEFSTAIAHSIREQTQLFTRSLYIISHPFDGRPIEDPDLVSALLPSPLPTVFRPQQQAKEYAPALWEMTEADLERNETIFSREQRRQKRSVNRRGGPQLPDLKERQRTIRTMIVSSVLPGAARDIENSRLYKRAAGGPRKRGGPGGARDGELSDSDLSDDSSPDSPAPSSALAQGTARTRGMRGAASVAQQRMANLGRSETPEASITHHHETRTSRRFGRDAPDDSDDRLIVTLRVGREKLRRVLAEPRGVRTPSVSQSPAPSHRARPSVGLMDPPSTPGPSASTPGSQGQGPKNHSKGAAPPPPSAAAPRPQPSPPPPPDWLTKALADLQAIYTYDSFEGLMKYFPMNPTTNQPIQVQAGQALPADTKYTFLPRVRCKDCPGKLYTPGADMTASNFEIHLKNNKHRERVNARHGTETRPAHLR
ncbi:related to transcription factor snf5p [Cephalotrichum gorgonifer]|uniref:Related to transcription factor snf5p n=1 Tax=Cephalotrichum gorgonifer TaxID=2041049 RepID=A0AAE8SWC3_9PEZI|nr:related to transcription factor snf5p [Cephalotrichum gorgonifer]